MSCELGNWTGLGLEYTDMLIYIKYTYLYPMCSCTLAVNNLAERTAKDLRVVLVANPSDVNGCEDELDCRTLSSTGINASHLLAIAMVFMTHYDTTFGTCIHAISRRLMIFEYIMVYFSITCILPVVPFRCCIH